MQSYNQNKPPQHQRECHRCRRSGRAPCQVCGGKGQVMTGKDLYGKPKFETCSGCFGLKTTRCAVCGGTGFI